MIRQATVNDVDVITNVHIASWRSAYKGLIPEEDLANLDHAERRNMWSASIQQHPSETIVAAKENSIIGFVNFGTYRDNEDDRGTAEIRAIYLLESFWGKGIGSELLDYCTDKSIVSGYTSLVLWVLESNSRAIEFYCKHGFKFDGQKKTETIRGVVLDEIRMSKSLHS